MSSEQTKVCTFADYIIQVRWYRNAFPEQREGQVYFNVLYAMRPDLSERVRGSSYDPFYKDEKIPMFLTFLGGMW